MTHIADHLFRVFHRRLKLIGKLIKWLFLFRKASILYNTSYLNALLRAIHLKRKRGFIRLNYASRLGLLDPALTDSDLSKYVDSETWSQLLRSINPDSLKSNLQDKGLFNKLCSDRNIPVPDLYAIFYGNTPGWSFNGTFLEGREAWMRFFEADLPKEFVIKPIRGFNGRGVNIYRRFDHEYIDTHGNSFNSAGLYETLLSSLKLPGFVIQDRVRSHPKLVDLSNTKYLQTIRVSTFIDNRVEFHILYAELKIITGSNIVDTFQNGMRGNLVAEVSLKDGILKPAVRIAQNQLGKEFVHTHPETGVSIDGFDIPLWEQVCSLVKETSFKFLPIRSIGFDVAVTPDSAIIIEGNMNWAAPYEHPIMGRILATMGYKGGNSPMPNE